MNIRQANELDLSEITRIYNQMIDERSTTAQLDRVTLKDREHWHQAQNRERYPVYLAERDGAVLGYLNFSPYRPGRRALEKTVEISYFVDQDYRGQGVGTTLLKQALQDCAKLNYENLLAILLETNSASMALLEKFSFQRWGYLPDIATIEGQQVGQYFYGINLGSKGKHQLDLKYHHLGVPSPEPLKNERYLSHLKMSVSGFGENPYGIEWLRYDSDADYPESVKRQPHLAFEVRDLEQALQGKQVIIKPNSPSPGVRVAFIEDCGLPIELMQIDRSLSETGI